MWSSADTGGIISVHLYVLPVMLSSQMAVVSLAEGLTALSVSLL